MSHRVSVVEQVRSWQAEQLKKSASVHAEMESFSEASGELKLRLNSQLVVMLVPEDAQGMLMLQEPDWLSNDVNSEVICGQLKGTRAVLDRCLTGCLRHTLLTSSQTFSSEESSSSGSISSGGEEDEMMLSMSGGMEEVRPGSRFNMSASEYGELMKQVEECAAVVGEESIRVVEELGCIKLHLRLSELMSTEDLLEFSIRPEVPVLVTLGYEHNAAPSVKCVQAENEHCFAVKTWLNGLIRLFVDKFFEGDIAFLEKRPNPPERSTQPMNWSVKVEDLSSSGKHHDTTPVAPPPVQKKAKKKTKKKGGMFTGLVSRVFGNKGAKDEEEEEEEEELAEKMDEPAAEYPPDAKLESIIRMGFDAFTAYNSLVANKMDTEAAVNDILMDPGRHAITSDANGAEMLSTMQEMGFPMSQAVHALLHTGFDFDKAVTACSGEHVESAARALVDVSRGNFFFRLLEYLGARLGNLSGYCVSCHQTHNCVVKGLVVCCEPLCVFRWEDQQLGEQLKFTKLCPFKNCGDRDLSVSHAAYLGQDIGDMSKQFGIDPQTLLEMLGHNYLPLPAMQKFFEALKITNAKKISNVLNPPLAARFERYWEKLRKTQPEAEPEVCFHGTSKENVAKIRETGFLLSKVGSSTDAGYYGAGIYTSPNAQLSVGYCRGGGQLLVCANLRGRIFKCTGLIMGAPLQDGYDSHEDPSGNEWICFAEEALLPCYLVEF